MSHTTTHVRGAIACVIACVLLSACAGREQRPAPPRTPVPPPPDIASVPDAIPQAEPRSRAGNPPFYEVFGKRYHVLGSAEGHVERGVASWYGPGFHNARTSNGEAYDMYAMTAAHRTLPLPCYARVTNLANGRSVVVRINDRGPFVGNRVIDLSYTAAARLDMLRQGTALVEVQTLSPTVPAPLDRAMQSPPPVLFVQAGAFAEERNALRLAERLRSAGVQGVVVRPPLEGGRLHRVRIGPVASVAEFDAVAARLAALGVVDVRLAMD
ncbi:MAG: septal ring lytic transglycosylase RlpA family protein [Steroidobacteraceae bacterium]